MSPRAASAEVTFPLRDFSRGTVGGISERGIARPNWLSRTTNLIGRPHRAMRVRPGSRDVSTAVLSDQPHSLMGYYSVGGNKLFVGAANKILEVQGGAYPNQTLPATHPAGSDIWSHVNLNGILITSQRGGAKVPLFYDGGWKELLLPKPAAAVTFAADSALTGGVDPGTNGHYYRVRWRYANGSSLAGPVSAKKATVAATEQVNINANLVPGAARGDYVGWTLERTKLNGAVDGPFYFVADGTAATYADVKPDASLGYIADEGLHGEPPHFDGLTSFAGLLFGWAGSSLYYSNAIGDLEATGIANFDADNLEPVAKDDGDTIQACIVVLNELLILKKRSVHILTGVDRESFVLTSVVYADPSRGSEAGCAGPRAAAVIGGKGYFWGESGGIFVYSARSGVSPFGWIEMGQYLDEANQSALDLLLLINHQGNYLLAWYPFGTVSRSEDQLVYDARYNNWWHWNGWRARDAIELKGGLFNSASMVICDPLNRSNFPAIANLATVSGSGIAGGTKVDGAVAAGDTTLLLDTNATATAQDVTLTIASIATPHCNTTSGSKTVTISEYHCWVTFDAFKDEKTASGSGGFGVSILPESPWLDGGLPDDWKDIDRIMVSADGDLATLALTISTDPPGAGCSLQMEAAGSGADWAADSGSSSNDLEWDVGDWAASNPTESVSGVPAGTVGKRFKLSLAAAPVGDFVLTGVEMRATLLPDREYDR